MGYGNPWSRGPELKRIVSSVDSHHISRSQQERLAVLEPAGIDEARVKTAAGKDAVSKASNSWERTPTPTHVVRWKAIQQARLKGLYLRAIARELGVARDTARQYPYSGQPPTKKLSAQETRQAESATQTGTRSQLTVWAFSLSI